MNEIEQIIKRLNSSILRSGYSYAELEKRSGISKSALQRYATGKTKKIPLEVINALSPILDVSPSYLMGWETELPEGVENNPNKLTDNFEENIQYLKDHDEDDLIELYNKIKTDKNLVMLVDKACELSPEQVEQILLIIDTFKKETVEKLNNTKTYK
ncbi:MAG: XRE family transcriptional regulator [Coprobacillus sp.]